jgi:hypothetical protein
MGRQASAEPAHPDTTATYGNCPILNGRWAIWQSETGQWWAARARPLTAHQQNAGAVPYLRAETPDELRQTISDEERLTTEGPGDPR